MNRRKMQCLCMALFLAFTMTGCGKPEKAPKLETPASESIQSTKAKKQSISREEVVTGYVTGQYSACYYTDAKEKISYKVSLGDSVTKGQVLAVADSSEYEKQIENLQQQLEQEKAAAAYEKKHVQLEIQQKKEERQNADVDDREETDEENAEQPDVKAEIKRMQTDLEYQEQLWDIHISKLNQEIAEAKKKVEENTLKAPADGSVMYINYNESVSAMESVVMISDVENRYIALQGELSEETQKQKEYVRIYTTYLGKEQDLKEMTYSEAEQQLAQKNTMILPRRFEIADDSMKLGDYLDVHIVLETKETAVTVPVSCVFTSNDSQYVYKVVNSRKTKCFVETGISDGVDIEIISGVEENDDIFYPVDEKVTYSGTESLSAGEISLWQKKSHFALDYPREFSVLTGVDEAKLISATDERNIDAGATLATLSVTTGQADVKEIESQISSLKRQYESQKKAGNTLIKQLKKQGKGSSKALKLAQLEQEYNKEQYDRQLKVLQQSLTEQSRKTGTVTVKAPCSGQYSSEYSSASEHTILGADAYLGSMKDTTIAYYSADNGNNIFHYGDRVQVTVDDNNYEGTVIGAYPAADEQEILIQSEDGMAYSYFMSPTENQTKAYIQLDTPVEDLNTGEVTITSNVISDVIVLPSDEVKKGENDIEYVWILKDGKPYKQPVSTLRSPSGYSWVLKGLSEGDVLLKGVE